MPPPLGKDERVELEAFKNDVKHEVRSMNEATVRHVEKLIAPFSPLPQKVEEIEKHTVSQTEMLVELKAEAGKSRKARIAARRERLKRAGADENWHRWRKRIAGGLALLVLAGEVWHAFFAGK